MLWAHTIRRLKPGTSDEFAGTFGSPEGGAAMSGPPQGRHPSG
jgi:hypothetical protein